MRKPMPRLPAGRTAWWIAATLVGALLITVASVAGVNAWNVGAGLNSRFQTIPDALPGPGTEPAAGGPSVPGRADAPAAIAGTVQNILVLGVDGGSNAVGASSTPAAKGVLGLLTADALRAAMVVHVPADRKSVSVVAVPLSDPGAAPVPHSDSGAAPVPLSDSGAAPVPHSDPGAAPTSAPAVAAGADTGTADTSIRAALAADGVAGAVRAAEDLLATHIDHVGAVDLAGFAAATKTLGGVTLDNPARFTSGGRAFPAGAVRLKGASALDWVRGPDAGTPGTPGAAGMTGTPGTAGMASTSGTPGTSTGVVRAEVQQLLLRAMLTAAVRAETLTTLRTLSELARRMAPFVAVDAGLTSGYLADLQLELRNIRSDVVFLTLPTTDAARRDAVTATFGEPR
ncbi:LCP family protein [Glaciibacter sp. 2TAF33]|uniref:LCP family protein n=1 Tax=Glaciibacter sp. 2TAF33 TaxID=3233015 RepID=UPI003F8D9DBE